MPQPTQPQLRQAQGLTGDILGELRHNLGGVLQQALDPARQVMLGAGGNAVMSGMDLLTALTRGVAVPLEQRDPGSQNLTPQHVRQRGNLLGDILAGVIPIGGAGAKAAKVGEEVAAEVPEVVVRARPEPPPKPEVGGPKMRIYHGSNADFDKFDAAHLGTGEGSAGYGHGFYGSTSKAVGDWYVRKMEITPPTTGRVRGGPGVLYDVDVPQNPEHYIDYHKPFSQQSKVVQDALSRFFGPRQMPQIQDLPMQDVLRKAAYHPDTGRYLKRGELEKMLRQQGVLGTRHVDAPSRVLGGLGHHSVVMFDPEDMEIVAKNGQSVGAMRSYRPSYNSERTGSYDPYHFSLEHVPLEDEKGNVLAVRQRLNPTDAHNSEIPAEKTPGSMFRGMSHSEYQHFLETGEISSLGDYNIGPNQKGLTYFSHNPRSAVTYSNDFAPHAHKASPGKHAYVIEAKIPEASAMKHVPGTDPSEIGVNRPIKHHEVVNVYRGRVVSHDPGEEQSGFRLAPSSDLHWEKIDLPKREPK